MKNKVKELMRMSGVTLKDVAEATGLAQSTVCRALNDSLTETVKSAARDLVAQRQVDVAKELANG